MANIVLAERDNDLRFILDRILNDAGHKVESLDEGSNIVNRKVMWPDVFILDQQMASIDGLALSKYLKINKETKDIPIIMISVYPEAKKKARQAGVNVFLQKPFQAVDLLESIERQLNQGA